MQAHDSFYQRPVRQHLLIAVRLPKCDISTIRYSYLARATTCSEAGTCCQSMLHPMQRAHVATLI